MFLDVYRFFFFHFFILVFLCFHVFHFVVSFFFSPNFHCFPFSFFHVFFIFIFPSFHICFVFSFLYVFHQFVSSFVPLIFSFFPFFPFLFLFSGAQNLILLASSHRSTDATPHHTAVPRQLDDVDLWSGNRQDTDVQVTFEKSR